MKTAIRMDDITPDMNWSKYDRICKILDTYQIKPLIGVVPYCEDETLQVEEAVADFGERIAARQAEGWTIALHGYNHLYTTRSKGIFPLNSFSEYAGVAYERQNAMIRDGIDRLRGWGLEPKIFMAPGHSFDKNTLRALIANGIDAVTDGFGDTPYVRAGVTFYPISAKRSDCISDKSGYTTYVLHTNTMSDEQIDAFERLIADNRQHFIDYDEYMTIEPRRRGGVGNIIEYTRALGKHVLVSAKASKGTVIHDKRI